MRLESGEEEPDTDRLRVGLCGIGIARSMQEQERKE